MATAVSGIDGRRAQRDVVSFRAPLDGPAGLRISVLVVDISPLGFMMRSAADLPSGQTVAIRLPVVGSCAARIVWSMGGRVGGEFVDGIPADPYRRMLAAAPNDKPAWNEF